MPKTKRRRPGSEFKVAGSGRNGTITNHVLRGLLTSSLTSRCHHIFSLATLPTIHLHNHVCDHSICHSAGPARYAQSHPRASLTALTDRTAKPMSAITPFRAVNAAFISSTSSKPAEPMMQRPGLVKGNPGTPPPMKSGMPTNVPLPSQEGTKGVMQYALYDQC